jgi:hypothetical protein
MTPAREHLSSALRRALAITEELLRSLLRQLSRILAAITNITTTSGDGGRVALDVAMYSPGLALSFAGKANTAALVEVPFSATVYTEQAANGQRSISSTSVLDAAAGTGARTVGLTYYSLVAGVVTGPFTETLTLNGIVAVNTVATNICFIAKMEVLTAGVGGVNAGIIQLFTLIAGGGIVFASIAVSDRRTFLGLTYIPTGADLYLTGVVIASTASTGNVPQASLRSMRYDVAAAAEAVVHDRVSVQGHTGSNTIHYRTPHRVTGPARLRAYVTPENVLAQVQSLNATYYQVPA